MKTVVDLKFGDVVVVGPRGRLFVAVDGDYLSVEVINCNFYAAGDDMPDWQREAIEAALSIRTPDGDLVDQEAALPDLSPDLARKLFGGNEAPEDGGDK